MTTKHSIMLLLSLVLALASYVGFSARPNYMPDTNVATFLTKHNDQDDCSRVKMWIGSLRSYEKSEREAAKNEIIDFSNKSLAFRQCTIKELIKVVTISGSSSLIKSQSRFFEWKESTDILGTIRAVEAIDALIDCLNCNNGPSGLGPGRYPATLAIIKIGSDAIPNLANALENKPLGIRFMAVQALYSIGGEKAKKVLETASRKEKDKQIVSVIKGALKNWNGSGKYKP